MTDPGLPHGRNRSSTPERKPNGKPNGRTSGTPPTAHAYMDRVEAGLEPEAEL